MRPSPGIRSVWNLRAPEEGKLAGILGLGGGSPRVPKRNVDTRWDGSTGSWRAAKPGGSFLFREQQLVYLGALAPTLALWSGGADSAPSPR